MPWLLLLFKNMKLIQSLLKTKIPFIGQGWISCTQDELGKNTNLPRRNKLTIFQEHLWFLEKRWRLWEITLIHRVCNLNAFWSAAWYCTFQSGSCESISVSEDIILCKILILFPFTIWIFFKKITFH